MTFQIGDIVLHYDKWHQGNRPHVVVDQNERGRVMLCPVTTSRKGIDSQFNASIPARVGGFYKTSYIASTDGNYTKQNLVVVDHWDLIPTGNYLNTRELSIVRTMIKLQQKKLRQRISR